MLKDNRDKKALRGNVMLYHIKDGIPFDHTTAFDQIDINCYVPAIPSPIPLDEIDFPTEVYMMYRYGPPLIFVEDKDSTYSASETLWNGNVPSGRTPYFFKSGDMMLVNYFADSKNGISAVSVVKLFIENTPESKAKTQFRKPLKMPESNLLLFDMGALPQFQVNH